MSKRAYVCAWSAFSPAQSSSNRFQRTQLHVVAFQRLREPHRALNGQQGSRWATLRISSVNRMENDPNPLLPNTYELFFMIGGGGLIVIGLLAIGFVIGRYTAKRKNNGSER